MDFYLNLDTTGTFIGFGNGAEAISYLGLSYK